MLRSSDLDQFNLAHDLAISGSADPQAASMSMPEIAAALARIAPRVRGHGRPNRIVRPATQVTLELDATLPDPSDEVPVNFSGVGRIVGMIATCAEGDQYRAYAQIRVSVNGGNDLFTAGRTAAFLPLSFLTGFDSRQLSWFELDEPVEANDIWQVQFKTETLLSTPMTITPIVAFLYEQENASRNR